MFQFDPDYKCYIQLLEGIKLYEYLGVCVDLNS